MDTIEILEKKECCGCGACMQICPKQAINMKENAEGFLYPEINKEDCVRIPMIGDIRSLNLSNSVAIVLYEALRQLDFDGFNEEGKLHRLNWKE